MTIRDDLICAYNAAKETTAKQIQQHVALAASRGKSFAIFYDRAPFDFNDVSFWCDAAGLNQFISQDLSTKTNQGGVRLV